MDWTTHVFLIKPGIVLHEGAFDVQVSNDDRFAMLATRSIPFNSKRLTSGEMALALSIGRLVESNVKLSSYFTRLQQTFRLVNPNPAIYTKTNSI